MSIDFCRFPFVVLDQIMKDLEISDLFSLYAVSKDARTMAKYYFDQQKWDIKYYMAEERLAISSHHFPGNYDLDSDYLKTIQSVRRNVGEAMLKFALENFKKVQLSIDCCNPRVRDFGSIMKLVKTSSIPVKSMDVKSTSTYNEDLMKSLFQNCSEVKNLTVCCSSPTLFPYNFRKNPPFKFDYVKLTWAAWVTKDHLVNLFMDCKRVIMSNPGFQCDDEALKEICQKWLSSPDMQFLEMSTVTISLEEVAMLPGAIELQGVSVLGDDGLSCNVNFDKGYKLNKSNGTPAIIYHTRRQRITFRTDFEKAVVAERL